MAWLHDILNQKLVDNQEYNIQNRILSNRRLGTIEIFSDYNKRKSELRTDLIWKFLREHCDPINHKIKNYKENLVLFNDQEYEHNSEGPFISITGTNGENFSLRTGNIIGFVKKGAHSLKISSRFGDEFLKYIIADADGFLKINEVGGITDDNSYDWLLNYLWITRLKRAFAIGLPKSYEEVSEDLTTVRGRLDIRKYYQNNHLGRYTCTYREHSYDNDANRLIVGVFKKLEDNDFIKKETQLKAAFYSATKGTTLKLQQANKVKKFSNPFYSGYNDVIDLSKLILKNKALDFGMQSKDEAFLFDISMLFEYFIRKLLKRQGFHLLGKFENQQKIPAGRPASYLRKLQPDLVITKEGKAFVFDVKYKSFDWYRYGINREDLFQIHTYYGQIANHFEVPACGFIYPVSEENWITHGLERAGGVIREDCMIGGKNIDFLTIFLKIPRRLSCTEEAEGRNEVCVHKDEERLSCKKQTEILWRKDFFNICQNFSYNFHKILQQ